jgi:hypothetical protein
MLTRLLNKGLQLEAATFMEGMLAPADTRARLSQDLVRQTGH